VLKLREQYPRWGKDKLVTLLHREGFDCSASMVGRILHKLKERGVLKEPIPNHISARKRRWQRPYAIRKPREYIAKKIGDIVEVDTLDVRPLPGVIVKHFTARDVTSRWDVLEAHSRATSNTASGFIDVLLKRIPFPVKAIQVDGGSEFQDAFERECQRRGIKLKTEYRKESPGKRCRILWTAPPTRSWPFPHTPMHSDQPLATSTVDRVVK